MATQFVLVEVEEHEAIPEGCSMRFKAQGDGREVSRVEWESEGGLGGLWRVSAPEATPVAYPVDDSSAGTSILVVGGRFGLRLTSEATGETVAEPYLLLGPDALR